ncbi:MAG: Dabb family protein [Lentisphaeraceae bacterium]|nr:Dabb family protein [Lentisphaeraceae bacterium]
MIKLTLSLIMVLMLNSCSTNNQPESQVQHIVMCWLKPDADKTVFINSVKSLKSIPEVQKISIGSKLESIEPVADNSFDLAFIITFKTNEELQTYLTHKDHVNAVEKVLKPALEKVVVYDFQEL